MAFIEGALSGLMLAGIASIAGWVHHNDQQHLRYTQWLYRRKEPATKKNSFVYKKRRFDRDVFIDGETTYIRSLKEDEKKAGYERLKKNSKLQRKYPGYYSALLAAYNRVFDGKKSIETGFLSISEQLLSYRKIYDPIDPSKDDFIICDQVFESCQDRLSIMSDDDYMQLYEGANGNFQIMALKIISMACDGVKNTVLQNAACIEHKIWAAEVAQRIDKIKSFYGNRLVDIVMNYSQDSDEEDAPSSEPQDDFLDDFEEVDISKEKEPLPIKKKEAYSRKNPLLILCIVLLAAVAIMLPIVTYYCGLGKGYSEGYSVGKDDWYNDGYNDGVYDGYKKGYNAGYDDGRAAVDLDVPYEAGYEAGYSDALNGY